MPPHDPALRDEARRLYAESPETMDEISAHLGIATSTMRAWARRDCWPPRGKWKAKPVQVLPPLSLPPFVPPARSGPAEPHVLLPDDGAIDVVTLQQRIYRAIDRNLSIMESRMNDENGTDGKAPERDMRALGTMVRSVEKLNELQPGSATPSTTGSRPGAPLSGRVPTTPEEEDALSLHLVERILKLRERRGLPDGDR